MKASHLWSNSASDAVVLEIFSNSQEFYGLLSNGQVRRIPDISQSYFQDTTLSPQHQQIAGSCSLNNPLLWTCSQNGSLSAWDFRASPNTPVCFSASGVANVSCMAVGYNGSLIACGTEEELDSRIVFYDARKLSSSSSSILGEYNESHSDGISKLHFEERMLFSGSLDGLVCGFDVSLPNETSALVSVMKPNSPVVKLGCFGSRGLYCTTSSETLHLFDTYTAHTLFSFDNDLETIGNNCRERLDPNVHNLVDCLWEPRTQKLILLGGSHSGEVTCAEVTGKGRFESLGPLQNGHTDVVRCATSLHQNGGFSIITGGEDGRIVLWTYSEA